MRNALRTVALIAVVAGALPGCFVKRWIWGPGPNEILSGDSAEVIYQKAQRLYALEEWKDASKAFQKVWRDNPTSDYAADAQFYDAESRYGAENFNGAVQIYKQHLQEHPLSSYAPLIQRRLYDIGVYLVEAGSIGYLGIFDYSDDGIEVLDFVSTAFPNGELADWALIYAADHEWRDGRYLDAIDRLHELLDTYPDSEWALSARLRLARAYRGVNRGQSYDADSLKRSEAQYRAYIELVHKDRDRADEYAELLEDVNGELAEVRETLARKRLDAADFYLRAGHVDAARTELQTLILEYPDTDAAATARERLGVEGATR